MYMFTGIKKKKKKAQGSQIFSPLFAPICE